MLLSNSLFIDETYKELCKDKIDYFGDGDKPIQRSLTVEEENETPTEASGNVE